MPAKINLSRTSKQMDWSAPVGGWRTDVQLADMPPDSAFVLDNFFPEPSRIRARYGSQSYATGLPAAVKTLVPYSGSTNKFFACSGSGIYDITSGGAVGAPVVSGLTSSHWAFQQITTSGGKFLVGVNGVDSPQLYNGSTWSANAITGPTNPNLLNAVTVYRSRLWFLESGTTHLWYLATDAITGAATMIEIGDVMKYGGTLVAIASWTIEVASGVQQMLVMMSSQGEVIVYQGSNPADATNWSLLGTFKLGRPLGLDRCFLNVGADLAIMTVDGIVPITKAIALDRTATDLGSLTKNISPSYLDAVADAGISTEGWQLLGFPRRRMVIINIPASTGPLQFVMNSETGAWCRFIGLSAQNWAVWNDNLYFGDTTGNVFVAETGGNDNGANIDCLMVGPWSRYQDAMSPKLAKLLTVAAELGPNSSLYMGMSADYSTTVPAATSTSVSTTNPALWGSALWGVATWPGTTFVKKFASPGTYGLALAVTIRALVSGSSASPSEAILLGGSVLYEAGSPV